MARSFSHRWGTHKNVTDDIRSYGVIPPDFLDDPAPIRPNAGFCVPHLGLRKLASLIQDKRQLEFFPTKIQGDDVCMICAETVAVFIVKRHYAETNGTSQSYDKLAGSCNQKLLCYCSTFSQQPASQMATLMSKYRKPDLSKTVKTMVENICPEKKQHQPGS